MECSEDIQQRHRKEKKELQAKIQALKKSATKGDKKKKREVSEEITKLELELGKRHNEELASLNSDHNHVENVTVELKKLSVSEDEKSGDAPEAGGVQMQGGRMSKAQRRREKKENEIRARELRISQQEAENMHGSRHIEMEAIKSTLKKRDLMIKEIPSDGNCLYKAVGEELLRVVGAKVTVDELRKMASEVMRHGKSRLAPFLTHPDTGDMYTDEEYDDYCTKVETTTAWGGHVELVALSESLKCRIEVIQGSGPDVKVGTTGPLLTLTYHRHMFGLGEHYNAVQAYVEDQDEADSDS